ncbi:hypothetical protein PV328_012391, partial [Microctonus aethiopoides]
MIRKRCVKNCVFDDNPHLFEYKNTTYKIISSIFVNGFQLKCDHPNNVVQLKNKSLFKIKKILKLNDNHNKKSLNVKDINFLGSEIIGSAVFKTPTSSIDVGITAVESNSLDEKVISVISAKEIHCKCISIPC